MSSASPLRVTFLITDLKVGGVPLHLHRLVTRLPLDRISPRVISLADEGPVGVMLKRAGVPVLGCQARGASDVSALWRLRQILAADPPDVLHSLLFHANIAARVVGPLAGVPAHRIVNEIQTVEIERKWHLLVDGLTCRMCRVEIGNSPSVLAHLHRAAHVPWSRLRCEWGAVDLEAIDAATPIPRVELGVGPEESLIVWSGRLDPIKGFEEMLEALALVRRTHRARLLLAGEGAYRPTVEALVRRLTLEDAVTLLGERRDVPRLLKSADLYLFCSRTEGLPNALIEAMAAGLPIVATKVPGCRDLIRDGESGVLVKSRDAADIAAAVTRLLDDRARAAALGRAARAWVSERLDARNWGARWASLYASLAASRTWFAGQRPEPVRA